MVQIIEYILTVRILTKIKARPWYLLFETKGTRALGTSPFIPIRITVLPWESTHIHETGKVEFRDSIPHSVHGNGQFINKKQQQ